jgi:WD40 repeat protein
VFPRAHASEVYAITALSEGRLASGGEDGIAQLLDLDGGCTTVSLRHEAFVRAVEKVRTRAGERLATAAYDGNVHLWRI